ncbi:hypothetical protein M0811_08590 [Anaeramoeba ignava]|uniref:CTLH domain-containing protein n=1 Tax=Anaeramoeba ignava TaxID=1746090 RepID=A0A9Q0LIL4_ANAIG|nr:hypothetical protein M0811_08590 [Anaeramoeba ignava]
MDKNFKIDEWERMLDDVKIEEEDLNRLVMNYLVVEGFKEAAIEFQKETKTKPDTNIDLIGERMEIRNTVNSGDIPQAIEKLNDFDPEVLDSDPKLYFHLQQQQLIELIKKGDINEILKFQNQNGQNQNLFLFLNN